MNRPGISSIVIRHAVIGYGLWAAVMCFTRLGSPVYIENEAREGIYVRAMLDTGNFVLPEVPNHVECGEIVPDKPPLFHWLAVKATWSRSILETARLQDGKTLSRFFNEQLLRFPSALTGVLTILGLIVFGQPIVGKRAAYLAAGCLLTSWQFLKQSRYGRVDMVFTCFVTMSMLLLLYFPDPDRIRIIPQAKAMSPVIAPGYYIFSEKQWTSILESEASEKWEVLWTDVLQEREKRIPLLMAVKKSLAS